MNKAPLQSLVDNQLKFYESLDGTSQDVGGHTQSVSTPQCSTISLCMSKSHQSSYSLWDFLYTLNSVVEEDIRQLTNACFFSLLLDESNDITGK